MSAPRMIHADGMDWPLETYLDANRFTRVGPFDSPPRPFGDVRFLIVTNAGELRGPAYSASVEWHEVLAFRPEGPSPQPCYWCGTSTGRDDICENCEYEAEYE